MTASEGAGAGRVLVTPRSLTRAGLDAVPELEPLRERGFELVSGPPGRAPGEAELLELVPGCVGWLAGVERISADVLQAAPGLRVVSRNGTGVDSVDVAAAERLGIEVRRAAGANAQGVAELALTLALACLRHVPWSSAALRAGDWERWPSRELAECTVGVVGVGAIGRRVAGLFAALGAPVVASDPFATSSGVEGVPLVALEDLLARSDVVTLHCPPHDDGRPLLDADRLALLPADAVLVNTARSALVDDDAVLAALGSAALSAYAVDAFDTEPPELTPLLRHERVLPTPHAGAYTGASVRRATTQAVEGLLDVLAPARGEGSAP